MVKRVKFPTGDTAIKSFIDLDNGKCVYDRITSHLVEFTMDATRLANSNYDVADDLSEFYKIED